MIKTLIVCDSRGNKLGDLLQSYIKEQEGVRENWHAEVRAVSGANIDELCKQLNVEKFNYYILAGGICSFTHREYKYGRPHISYDCNPVVREIRIQAVKERLDALRQIHGDRLNIATIPPASIEKHNVEKNPHLSFDEQYLANVKKEQEALIEDLDIVNQYITESNIRHNVETINWKDYVYRSSKKRARSGNRDIRRITAKFNNTDLYDGVHFNKPLRERAFKRLATILARELIRVSTQIDYQESSGLNQQEQEEDCSGKLDSTLDTSKEDLAISQEESSTTSAEEDWDYKRKKRQRLQSEIVKK